MNGPETDPDDIREMRKHGDLRAFMRAQISIGKSRKVAPPAVKPPPPPGHRPGAWPTGTRPPDPLKPQPPGAWAEALDQYRAGIGAKNDPCHCGGCHPTTKEDQ
ncbi:hypothetical protein ACIOHC_13975 [Streptomyces sp. NPDC088252]|uniref:hypothetical protein n=1 Tax=unclassified Streptomyces TaxID=2593676 RepID=UPI00380DC24C